MSEQRNLDASSARVPSSSTKVYRSVRTGRIVSHEQRVAAARARVAADKLRGTPTADWIVQLARRAS